jgi:hypothetical protein
MLQINPKMLPRLGKLEADLLTREARAVLAMIATRALFSVIKPPKVLVDE